MNYLPHPSCVCLGTSVVPGFGGFGCLPCPCCLLRYDRNHCAGCDGPLGASHWESRWPSGTASMVCGAACRAIIDRSRARSGLVPGSWKIHLRTP